MKYKSIKKGSEKGEMYEDIKPGSGEDYPIYLELLTNHIRY